MWQTIKLGLLLLGLTFGLTACEEAVQQLQQEEAQQQDELEQDELEQDELEQDEFEQDEQDEQADNASEPADTAATGTGGASGNESDSSADQTLALACAELENNEAWWNYSRIVPLAIIAAVGLLLRPMPPLCLTLMIVWRLMKACCVTT